MPCRMKKARGPRGAALPWWRMRHEDLGMPLPAVYLPQRGLRAAHSAGPLLLVIGPDDAPVLDAAKARDDAQDALPPLWTFTSAIAALHVIIPARYPGGRAAPMTPQRGAPAPPYPRPRPPAEPTP